MEATIRHEQSFVAAKDSISKTDKNYNEAVMKSRATTLAFGSTNKRGAGLATPITDLESYTPVTGPLKKRLKYRYSLGSNYSLFTPSGFYSLTPDFASCKKDMKSLTARNDIRVPRIRTPLSDISTPNAANFRHGSDQILKKPAPKFLSPKKENRKKPDHAVHVRSLAASALVQRKQKLRNLFQMSKPSRSYIPPTAKSTPILLPHSPIATKASNGIHQSSGRNTDSLEDYYTKSYMCFIRNQYEFFELSSDDVALCKDRNVSVEEGQVAMRCRHCTCIDLSFRPKGSLAVAKKHETLYKHFYDRKSSHVEELCPFVPKITRKQLVALRYQDSTFGRTPFGQDFAYWCAKAKALGVVETPKGLRFKTSLLLQAKTDRFSMSRNIAENFQNMEHSKAVASPPYEQCRLLQDQRSGAVEHPHVSWGKTFASDNPKSTIGNLSSKVDMEECDGLNDSDMEECDGLKCSVEQAQEAQTWRQKASESNWHNRLREFIDFKYRNGHGMVPQHFAENRQLGIWVNKQRMAKRARDEDKTSSMTDERINLLEKAGFTWAKPKGIRAWEEKFHELKKYFEEHGHCNVPTKWKNNRSLGRFVSNMRKHYKEYVQTGSCSIGKNEMDRRIRLLEGINFSWSLLPDRLLSEEDDKEELSF